MKTNTVIINKGKKFISGIHRYNKFSHYTCLLICHGLYGKKQNYYFNNFSQRINFNKVSLFSFDFTGHGDSCGRFNLNFSISQQILDISRTISYLQQSYGYSKFILFGISLGATASLFYSIKFSAKISQLVLVTPRFDFPLCSFFNMPMYYLDSKKYTRLPKLSLDFPPTFVFNSHNDEIVSKEKLNKVLSKIPNVQIMNLDCTHILSSRFKDDVITKVLSWANLHAN